MPRRNPGRLNSTLHRYAYANRRDDRQNHQDKQHDLPDAPRPLALHFARARVHQEAIGLVAVAVRAEPDRQQDVLEPNVVVTGLDAGDALRVAARQYNVSIVCDLWYTAAGSSPGAGDLIK